MKPATNRGFTLIEVAIVLFIITLALGGLLMPMARQAERRNLEDTQKQLDEIRTALLGYAVGHKHLPCPDTDATPDGLENRNADGTCVAYDGALPWQDLGVGQRDPWNHPFRYAVTKVFADGSPQLTFTLASNGNLRVNDPLRGITYLSNAVAVVLSHGQNGLGAPGSGTTPTSADELENSNADAIFRSREITTAYDISQGSGQSEFDDIVTWLPPALLFDRMVNAGQLP